MYIYASSEAEIVTSLYDSIPGNYAQNMKMDEKKKQNAYVETILKTIKSNSVVLCDQ